MEWRETVASVTSVLDVKLFEIAGTPVTVGTAFASVAIAVSTLWISRLLQRGAERFLNNRGVRDEGTVVLGAMAAIGIGLLVYFRKKGWF